MLTRRSRRSARRISYYKYYRPESYNPGSDKYFSKVSSVDPELNAMRHRATKALFERRDTVVVASVSCIYGLGVSSKYLNASFELARGQEWRSPAALCARLREIGYARARRPPAVERVFERGRWRRVSPYGAAGSGFQRSQFHAATDERAGDCRLYVWPPYEESCLEVLMDVAPAAARVRAVRRLPMRAEGPAAEGEGAAAAAYAAEVSRALRHVAAGADRDGEDEVAATTVYPATHHATSAEELEAGCLSVEAEMEEACAGFEAAGKLEEAERLRARCLADLEMLRAEGVCPGLENYSLHFSGRRPGEAPETLIDYMGAGGGRWTCFIDESHVTVPQLRAMYEADRSRKAKLIEHGFRLPSALENRPLRPEEFWARVLGEQRCVFVSATPGDTELEMSARACAEIGPPAVFHGQRLLSPGANVVEMVLRPTFVVEPEVSVLPTANQLDALVARIAEERRAPHRGKALVLTVLKKDAEDLAEWLADRGVRAAFIHSGVDTTGRSDILRALQEDELDCIVGVNLLREGIDLPQVSLVAVLDADKEGFLRSDRALIQMAGRAARNAHGKVVFFADRRTEAMRNAIGEMDRRRRIQRRYNEVHGKVPVSARQREHRSIFDLVREEEGVSDLSALLVGGGGGGGGGGAGGGGSPARRRAAGLRRPEGPIALGAVAPAVAGGPPPRPPPSSIEGEMPHVAALRDMVDAFPATPGVYVWSSSPELAKESVLYVGKSRSLRSRAMSYLTRSSRTASYRIRMMLEHARCCVHIETEDDAGALLMEAELIKRWQPRFNVKMRDASSYPYILVDHRQKLPAVQRAYTLPSHAEFDAFGPFTDRRELSALLDRVERAFRLRRKAVGAKFNDAASSASYLSSLQDCVAVLRGDGARILRRATEAASADGARLRALADLVDACGTHAGGSAGLVDVAAVVTEEGAEGRSPTCSCAVAIVSGPEDGGDGTGPPAGRTKTFTYVVEVPWELGEGGPVRVSAEEVDEVFFRVLERHYIRLFGRRPSELVTLPGLDADRRGQLESLLRARAVTRGATEPRVLEGGGAGDLAGSAAVDAARAALESSVRDKERARRSLVDLRDSLRLGSVPALIEAYDISHFGGSATVASRVAFEDGKPAQHLYRRYNIRSLAPGRVDDYAAVREVMRRRAAAGALPDLIVIDGGKGQLSAAREGIAAVEGAPAPRVVALAKREEEVFVAAEGGPVEGVRPLARSLLMHMRDEAHRFALSASRKRRSRKLFESTAQH